MNASSELLTQAGTSFIGNPPGSNVGLLNNVFVYGTFMPNHERNSLLEDFEGFPAETKYVLYDLVSVGGKFPGLVDGKLKVKGYLYKVDLETLLHMDQIEGTNYGMFYRKKIRVKNIKLDKYVDAWAYFLNIPEFLYYDVRLLLEHPTIVRNSEHVYYEKSRAFTS